MLLLYNTNHGKIGALIDYKDYHVEQAVNIDDLLHFSYPVGGLNYSQIAFECYVSDGSNEYVIKEINIQGTENGIEWAQIVCKINLEDLKGHTVASFATVGQKAADATNLALTGTGWTVGYCDVTKLRTVRKAQCSAYDVLSEIAKAYTCEITYNAILKTVIIHQKQGADRGTYFAEQLNLKQLQSQGNSNGYVTRLIPVGKDGLDISSVNAANGGVKFVSDYQYSTKVITGYWVDNRYTVAQDLKDDAIERLAYLSKPTRAYAASIIDLANVSPEWGILDFGLGDFITLLSESKNIREQQRIVKIDRYPEEPERSTIQIANRIVSLEDIILRMSDAMDTVELTTDTTGSVVASSVAGNLNNAYIAMANVGDLNVTIANIGTLIATKATITSLDVTNANVTNLTANKADVTALTAATGRIGTLEVNSATIAQLAVTDARITNIQIGTAQIIDASITTAKIGLLQVTSAVIALATIGTAQIANGAITTALIGTAAIGTTQIADGSITDAKIIGLTANKITAGTINAALITVTNLNAANITVGTINGVQIADGAIDVTKLGITLANDINNKVTQTQVDTSVKAIQIGGRNLLKGTATNTAWWSSGSPTGNTTRIQGKITVLVAGEIGCWNALHSQLSTNSDANNAHTLSVDLKLSTAPTSGATINLEFRDAVGTFKNVSISLMTLPLGVWTRVSVSVPSTVDKVLATMYSYIRGIYPVGTTIEYRNLKLELGNKATDWTPAPEDVDAVISTAQTTADGKSTVYYSTIQPELIGNKINDIWLDTDDGNKMYKWDGAAWAAAQFGTNAIANLAITNALIADATILNAKIATLDAGKITTGLLAAARIDALAITSDKLAANSVIAGKLAAGVVTANEIAANTIIAGNIAAGTITAAQIAAGTITASLITAATITGDKLVVDAITAREIATETITANEIAALTITAAKIAAGTITAAQMTAGTITAASGIIGSIDANKITTGTLSANFISGGALILGGSANVNGVFNIKNALGATVITGDNTGLVVDGGSYYIVEPGTQALKTTVYSLPNLLADSSFEGVLNYDRNPADVLRQPPNLTYYDYNPELRGNWFGWNTYVWSGSTETTKMIPHWATSRQTFEKKEASSGQSMAVVNLANHYSQGVDLAPGQTYFLSASHRQMIGTGWRSNAASKLRLEVAWSNGWTETGVLITQDFVSTTAWQRSGFMITVPATGVNGARIRIKSPDGNWIYVDGVQLVQGSVPGKFEPSDDLWSHINGETGFNTGVTYYDGVTGNLNVLTNLTALATIVFPLPYKIGTIPNIQLTLNGMSEASQVTLVASSITNTGFNIGGSGSLAIIITVGWSAIG